MTNQEKYFSDADKTAETFCSKINGYKPCTHIDILIGSWSIKCLKEEHVEHVQEHAGSENCRKCILRWLEFESDGTV